MTEENRGPATVADVAALAGVSSGTASKALNGSGQLRDATRERVLEAARKLGYQPNALARSLVRGRSYTVGLLTSDTAGRFSLPLMLGVENALGAGRISVFLCDARGDAVREQYYLDSLLARRVDGIIVTGWRTDPRPPLSTRPLPVPVVYAYTRSTAPQDVAVLPDDEQGGYLAGSHLIQRGRRKIAHITGTERFEAARLREAGLRTALAEHGLAPVEGGVLYGDWSEAWGRHATQVLLDSETDFDAVFCGSDQIARGVADQLRDHRLTVPDDVALVGFDNWDVFAETTRPALTSIDMDLGELGAHAAQRLLELIEGGKTAGVQRMPCRLVERESSRPATASVGTRPYPASTAESGASNRAGRNAGPPAHS